MNIHTKFDILRHQNRQTKKQNYKKYIGPHNYSEIYRYTLTYTVKHMKIETSIWRDTDEENLCLTLNTDTHMEETEEILWGRTDFLHIRISIVILNPV